MATYTRLLLSGAGAGGIPIIVVATATPGTLIHTAVAGTASFDEVYLWVSNVTASDATLTIEWGSVVDPGGLMTKAVVVPANSPPTQISFGVPVNGTVIVRAFSGTASALNITGFINRIA